MNAKKYIILTAIIVIAAILVVYIFYQTNSNKTSAYKVNFESINLTGKVLGIEVSGNETAMDFAVNNRVKYFRTDIRMNSTQMQNISRLSNEGVQILGILDYDTLGAQPSSSGCLSNCNWTLNDWNKTVSQAVLAYPEVHVWEIWNEPLATLFQSGFNNGSAYNYYLMAKSAYSIIKQHNSSDTVICLGGANMYSSGSAPDQSSLGWTKEAWSYGLGSYCDGISLHAYTSFIYLPSQRPADASQTAGQILNESLSDYENLTGKPIWITETGLPSNNESEIGLNDSEQKQAEFVNQTLYLLLSKKYVKGVFWFNLAGYADPPYNLDFGLLNGSTLEPKPSWYSFKGFLNRSS